MLLGSALWPPAVRVVPDDWDFYHYYEYLDLLHCHVPLNGMHVYYFCDMSSANPYAWCHHADTDADAPIDLTFTRDN